VAIERFEQLAQLSEMNSFQRTFGPYPLSVFMRVSTRRSRSGGLHPVGEKQNQPFQLSSDASLEGRFPGIAEFLCMNLAVPLFCFEFLREGQPLGRMIVVALLSFPVLNLVGWLGWRLGSRR